MDASKNNASAGGESQHSAIAQQIRENQRRYQSSLLVYMPLVETLASLKPESLPLVRQAYSKIVSEGILSKKRMKVYFKSLPTAYYEEPVELREYPPASLGKTGPEHARALAEMMVPVNAADIEAALTEMLPVIAREAYFTAALFGLAADDTDKKKNFEAVKKSVDASAIFFNKCMIRVCGIWSRGSNKIDAMLSFVATVHLQRSMAGYLDRQNRGGEHSLSLAYVRSTILNLKEQVEKQWTNWIKEQIEWIGTHPGVPISGKQAGVFASFARLPTYVDHLVACCGGEPATLSQTKVARRSLQRMAQALFDSLEVCAEREGVDRNYAADVMRMENSYFFAQTMQVRPEVRDIFETHVQLATAACKDATDSYLGWMIQREFKPLHALFSKISKIRKEVGDADIPIHVPKANFTRTLAREGGREVLREKISALHGRMEKHLCPESQLLSVTWKQLVKVLYEWFGRFEKLSSQCYGVRLEPSAVDVVRMAKAAAGLASSNSSQASLGDGAGRRGSLASMGTSTTSVLM
uniref:Exocyst complex component Sec3 C-terminal domain-containing protein n=1 Tax=Corethron hystrix TaxID=216773 RepID=A0A6U5I1L8_9STRA